MNRFGNCFDPHRFCDSLFTTAVISKRYEMITKTQYPMLIERIQSLFIDLILMIVLMYLFSAILDKFQDPPNWIRITLYLGIWAIYAPLCTATGCTLGQYIKGIRVRSFPNMHRKINFVRALVRYVIKTTLGWISFITINTNPEKRAIHDFAGESVMIKLNAG